MTTEIEKHLRSQLRDLRDTYATSTQRQRANKAVERLAHPDAYPNALVTRIAGIEAFARSLVMHTEGKTKTELREAYKKFRNWKPTSLVREYCHLKSKDPAVLFGEENWRLFGLAIEYRNLLIHECAYLGHQKYAPLESACERVFMDLVRLSRVKLKHTSP